MVAKLPRRIVRAGEKGNGLSRLRDGKETAQAV